MRIRVFSIDKGLQSVDHYYSTSTTDSICRRCCWLSTLVLLFIIVIVVLVTIRVRVNDQSKIETEDSSTKCIPDKSRDRLSPAIVTLLNVDELQFNNPNQTIVLRFSYPILNISRYSIIANNISLTNSTNTTSNITILDEIIDEKVILSFIALDIYELPIVGSFDLYFGSISMPVRVLFSNGSVAVNVLVHANLTDFLEISQSGYTDENGTVIFTNVPYRTISLFARTIDNQIALSGIVPSSRGITLVLIPFGHHATTNTNAVIGLKSKSFHEDFPRRLTKRDTELSGFAVNTSGQQLQITSRIFMKEKASNSIYVRYEFITEEIPHGFFGTKFNDYFTVTIRSQKGSYESLSQSMNGLGFGAFNNISGATNWYTLKLKISSEPELIQVDVGVSNVGDSLFPSQVLVDKIGIETCDKCSDCDRCQSNPICRDTCLNPPLQSCLFYTDCMKAKIDCGGDNEYANSYGRKYCNKYFNRLPFLTSQGQDWIYQTMNCLQKTLVSPLQNCNQTCETLQQIALASQSSCYINSGLCDLSADDLYQIFTTIGGDLFNSDDFIEALKTTTNCLPTTIDHIENRLLGQAIHNRLQFEPLRIYFVSMFN